MSILICGVGMMENLLLFYGDMVRDGIFGLDVSQCESINIVVRDMKNLDLSFSDCMHKRIINYMQNIRSHI
jgi:hypothetical protein